jgi:hypothetical protein
MLVEFLRRNKMQNNLTKKDIEKLNKWAKKYDIKKLQTKDKNKLLNIKELTLSKFFREEKNFLIFQMKFLNL